MKSIDLNAFMILYFVFRRLMEHVEMGSDYNGVGATSKFEIRRGPSAVSPHVNGSNLEL